MKGLAGRWRRVAARAGFITSSMRLPGGRHWFLGYQFPRAPGIDSLTGARVRERIGLPPDDAHYDVGDQPSCRRPP